MLQQPTNETAEMLFQEFWKNTSSARELMTYYKCAIMEIETKFHVLDEQFSLRHNRNPIKTISSRLKSPMSIYEKLRRKNLPTDLKTIEETLFDVAGIRIICSFVDDIYMLRDCLLSQDDIHLIQEKDYIKNPKENGYRSLHLIVEVPIFLQSEKRLMKAEIQLRTIAMDSWASLEHSLRYKQDLDSTIQNQVAEQLFECAKFSSELDRIMMSIKNTIEQSVTSVPI